jgi:hypothetical protein
MASAPSDPRPVLGRIDRNGRLIAADAELAALQSEAGSSLGSEIALPQIAAIARLARKLGVPVSRPAIAAGAEQDYELWVRAVPEGDEIALVIERWIPVPARRSRLSGLVPTDADLGVGAAAHEWITDEQLRVVSLPQIARQRRRVAGRGDGLRHRRAVRPVGGGRGIVAAVGPLARRRPAQQPRELLFQRRAAQPVCASRHPAAIGRNAWLTTTT